LLSNAEDFINRNIGFLPKNAFKKNSVKKLNIKDYKNLERLADDIAITKWLNTLNVNFNVATLYDMAN
jgi:hypothetical protein